MKSAKALREETVIDAIVESLKSVPKTRLRIVRDIVGALAEPPVSDKDTKRGAQKSLLKTAFCGMWKGRTEIGNGRSYAKAVRQRLESRGDRT